MEKIEIYFSKLFSSIILKNKIVATILYNIMILFKQFNERIDNEINNDI